MTRQLRVTRLQAELARAKVEADRARQRTPDPLLVKIAALAAPADDGDAGDGDTGDGDTGDGDTGDGDTGDAQGRG